MTVYAGNLASSPLVPLRPLSTSLGTVPHASAPCALAAVMRSGVLSRPGRAEVDPRTQAGHRAASWSDLLYGHTVTVPMVVDAGYVGAQVVRDLEIWNTSDADASVTAVVCSDGLSTTAVVGDDIPPRGSILRTVSVSPLGDPAVTGTVALTLSTGHMLAVAVTGTRLVVWTLWPGRPMTESLEWLTRIFEARSGAERREGQRVAPRWEVTFAHVLDTAAARSEWERVARVAQDRDTLVPLWQSQVRATGLQVGDTGIAADLSDRLGADGFAPGGLALVRGSLASWEVKTIADVTVSGLTLSEPLTRAYPRAVMLPLRRCRMSLEFSRVDLPSGVAQVSATLSSLAPEAAPASAPVESWQGYEVLQAPFFCSASGAARSGSRGAELLDPGIGLLHRTVHTDAAREAVPVMLLADSRSQSRRLRELLHRLAGRAESFWLPTFRADLVPVADVADGGNVLRVVACGASELFVSPTRRAVRIELTDGTVLYRLVTAAASAGDGVDQLVFSEVIDGGLAVADVARVSWMSLARLDADRVEIVWTRAGQASVTVNAREVWQ